MPWMGACWMAGSSAFRWPAMDGQLRLRVVPEVADETAADAANGVVRGTVPDVVPARWNVVAAVVEVAAGRIPVRTRAPVTDPAPEANLPAERTPDRAAPWTEPTTKNVGRNKH